MTSDDAAKIGRTSRWKLMPLALAAVISECRVSAPIEKTAFGVFRM